MRGSGPVNRRPIAWRQRPTPAGPVAVGAEADRSSAAFRIELGVPATQIHIGALPASLAHTLRTPAVLIDAVAHCGERRRGGQASNTPTVERHPMAAVRAHPDRHPPELRRAVFPIRPLEGGYAIA